MHNITAISAAGIPSSVLQGRESEVISICQWHHKTVLHSSQHCMHQSAYMPEDFLLTRF